MNNLIDGTITDFDEGDLVNGTVVKIEHDEVLVDIGFKSEGVIPVRELSIRKDDAPETVRKRLEVYHATTEILKDFYGKLGRLRVVEGNQPIEKANEDILKAIGAQV